MRFQNHFFDSNVRWLYEHRELFNQWFDEQVSRGFYDLEDHAKLLKAFIMDPNSARILLENYSLPNEDKINHIHDMFDKSEYSLAVVFGDPGSGKTTFIYDFLYRHYQRNKHRKIYVLGTWTLPEFIPKSHILFDINKIPSGSTAYIAEIAKFFPSREGKSSENRKVSSAFTELRHHDIKLICDTQRAASCDINFLRYANFWFFKYMNPMTIQYEREDFLSPFLKFLLPKKFHDKRPTVGFCRAQYFTFDSDLPSFYTDDISKNLSSITDSQKIDYAKYLLQNSTPQAVMQTMDIRFRFQKNLEFYKDLHKQVNPR